MRQGIDVIHTCSLPMANGPSLPSTEGMIEILTELGNTHGLDESQLPPVAEHFAREAAASGYALGVPNEFRLLPYKHQLPGGMTGTLINQLAEHGMSHRLNEVIDEIVIVRSELGEPIMATPFSQFVGIQAVLNIVTSERYSIVPDEVIQYTLGHYGPLMRPVQPDIADRILSQPRAAVLEKWERPQPTLSELRQQLGAGLTDEELLLRALLPDTEVDAMLAAGPIRTAPTSIVDEIAALVRQPESVRHIQVARPGLSVELRR
jgi:oxaloacetate decarboxylase alpha subunit